MDFTRRRLLAGTAGALGVGSLAGCTGDTVGGRSSGSGPPTAQASFFVFGDLASRVAGDTTDTSLLVPIGQHGHGWEPGPRVREEISNADLFVHGMVGFQPWVDDIRADLEADDSDVTTVDVSASLELLEAGGGHDGQREGNDHENHDDHQEDEDHDDHQEDEDHDDHQDDHKEDTHDGHEHGSGMDPHFWMDPLRVEEAVANVRRGLVDIDADGADAYAENAESLSSELDDLHHRIGSAVAGSSTDVILVAGHDSFQYLGDRYGIGIESLTDVSPDDRPTPRDIERAQSIIDAHDLRYVCADPLESQRAADQLVAETDAEAVLPLTAMPGLTEAWAENDWGYIEVMENVNLPTLRRVLETR
jgi:zinc transport system substrate-binding protein